MILELPVIPHEATGVECGGTIAAKVSGNDAELVCGRCGAVVGVVQSAILRDMLSRIPEINPAPPKLLRSHTELRGALIFAGRRICKLTFGRRDDEVLPILRRVLREARTVARLFRQS